MTSATRHTGTKAHARCGGCGCEIDPVHCWCGSPMEGHGHFDGHGAIPMGCNCGRETELVPDEQQDKQP
jgi:hypothetical protein